MPERRIRCILTVIPLQRATRDDPDSYLYWRWGNRGWGYDELLYAALYFTTCCTTGGEE